MEAEPWQGEEVQARRRPAQALVANPPAPGIGCLSRNTRATPTHSAYKIKRMIKKKRKKEKKEKKKSIDCQNRTNQKIKKKENKKIRK